MVKIWDPWHPLPLLYYNINIYSLQKKASVESIAELEWCEYFVTFPQGNFQQWICHDHNLLVLQQLHCESLYLHILFSTLDRVHTTDCVCLYFIFSCLECMQLHVAASQMYIFKLMFSSIRRRLLYSLYTREVTTCCTVYTREVTTYVPR